jgi:hypothetical protein
VAAGASAVIWIAACTLGQSESLVPEVSMEPPSQTIAEAGVGSTGEEPDLSDPLLDGANLELPLGVNLEPTDPGERPTEPLVLPGQPPQVTPTSPPPQHFPQPVVVRPEPPKPPEREPIRLAGRRAPPSL